MRFLCFLFPLFLASCAAPSVHYYQLQSDPVSASEAGARPAQDGLDPAAVGLRLVVTGVPASVERLQIVVRDPAQDPDSAVQVLHSSLWSSPLSGQLQAVLSSAVSQALGLVDLQDLPGAQDMASRDIQVRVSRFDMTWGQSVDLAATWTGTLSDGTAQRVCQARIQRPAGTGVAVLVEAQQQAVQQLARLIVVSETSETLDGLQLPPEVSEFGCTRSAQEVNRV